MYIKLNLAEAESINILMSNKFTYYMILLQGRSYAPSIKQSCGSFVELEKLINTNLLKKDCTLYIKKYHFIFFIAFFLKLKLVLNLISH